MKTQITVYLPYGFNVQKRIKLEKGCYATLRLSADGKSIRDGKVYSSEKFMRANRAKRPDSARMFWVERVPSETGRFFSLTEIV